MKMLCPTVIAMDLQVSVLGWEKEGILINLIQVLDACMEIPQLSVIRSFNVHVSGAIVVWEYIRQQRSNYNHFKVKDISISGTVKDIFFHTSKILQEGVCNS
jgi:hypothetical protein